MMLMVWNTLTDLSWTSVKVCPSMAPFLAAPHLADRKPRKTLVSLVTAKISVSSYIPSRTKPKQ